MRTRAFRAALLAAAALALDLPAHASAAEILSGEVVRIVDGDSISLLVGDDTVRVRLEGIDCPERGQDFTTRARKETARRVYGRTVRVVVKELDAYGRSVGRVTVDGEDVSLALVRAGLAWHYTRYSDDPELAAAEREARSARRGLWSRADAIPPWEFRRRAASGRPAISAGGPYHGNTRSRVFHAPDCPHYDCKNCTEVFATREEAIAAGYRPGGSCRP